MDEVYEKFANVFEEYDDEDKQYRLMKDVTNIMWNGKKQFRKSFRSRKVRFY